MIFAFALSLASGTAPSDSLARREVDGILSRLRISGCRFQRNGSWYDAGVASDHLARKRKHLAEHGGFASAEEFIDKVGSASSLTGRPYMVQCADRPAEPSGNWLRGQLRALRKGDR